MDRFEAHLTVEAEGERREAFAALCRELGVKCVLIELARGAHRSQPMTSSHHTGEIAVVRQEIAALRARVEAAGFTVTRTKIEADVTNAGVPADDAGATGTYFEFHAKLLLPTDADLGALRARCEASGAHLSQNEIEPGARFVTLRVYEAGRNAATAAFTRLLDALHGYEIVSTKAELTLFDSCVELDAGWL